MSGLAALLLLLQAPPGPTLTVPPEAAVPGPEAAWVAEAVAELLPRALLELGVPAFDRGDRLRAQSALEIPPVAITRASSIRIAEALGASRLVVGRHEMKGPLLELSVRLLDVQRGTLSAPLTASGLLERLPELVRSLAWDIALSGPTRPRLTRDEFLAGRADPPLPALRFYAEGLAAPDAASRVRCLERAIALAPGFGEARLALARLQLEAAEHVAALGTLKDIAGGAPVLREARFLTGVALLRLGRYAQASNAFLRLTSEDASAASLNNYGLAVLRLGRSGSGAISASQILRKAAEMDAASTDLAFNLGWALLAEGEAEAAAFWLGGVTRQDPDDAPARLVLAWALRRAGRAEEAEQEWKRLLATDPSYEPLRAPDPGRRFERIVDSERRLVLDQEGRSDAELAAAHVGRAEKLLEAGDHQGAMRELTRAVYLHPRGARVHLLLGQAHRSRGDRPRAVSELRMSLWCREDPVVRVELASLLREMGELSEARAEARKVLKADPSNAAARKLLENP